MLKSLRNGAKSGFLKFILMGFMVLAVGGLVLTDVGGFFRGGGISQNYVAKGKDGIEISTMSFDRTARRVLARQGMSPQDAYALGLINQILNSEVQTLIITREAQKLGLVVDDKTVTAQISKLAEPLASEGTSKADAIKQILRSQGISEAEFIGAIRQEMSSNLLRGALAGGAGRISDAQAADLYSFENEARDFSGFVLKNSDIKDINTPSDESLERYYESNKMGYLIAETRDITIATLKKEMIAGDVKISDDDLRAAYAENIESYKKPEMRKLQQAILSTQQEAQKVFEQTEDGKSLERAVKDTTGKTAGYLGENDFTENGLLEIIAEPVFAAKKGDVIGPVQSPLGFHVMVLKDIIEPQTQSFETVKAALNDSLMHTRLEDDLIETANQLDDQLAGGAPLAEVVKEMGLTTEAITGLNQAGINAKGIDELAAYQGDKAQILEAAFDYKVGESSPVMELADGRFITIHVDNIKERSYTPFADVKDQLLKSWKSEQQKLANQARAEDILTKIKSGTSLADAAKEMGVNLQSFNNLKRNEEAHAPLTIPALRNIFDVDKNVALNITNPDGFIIGEVVNITLADPTKAEKEIKAIQGNVKDSMPQEILTLYVNALADKYKVKINDRVLETVYGTTTGN